MDEKVRKWLEIFIGRYILKCLMVEQIIIIGIVIKFVRRLFIVRFVRIMLDVVCSCCLCQMSSRIRLFVRMMKNESKLQLINGIVGLLLNGFFFLLLLVELLLLMWFMLLFFCFLFKKCFLFQYRCFFLQIFFQICLNFFFFLMNFVWYSFRYIFFLFF